MNVSEIFNLPHIIAIEEAIIDKADVSQNKNEAVQALLSLRKDLLDNLFYENFMNKELRGLLNGFNDALANALRTMRLKTISAFDVLYAVNVGIPQARSRCFFGDDYPLLHPIQTERAKEIDAVLRIVSDGFNPGYKDGVTIGPYRVSPSGYESENELLYLSEEPSNFNESFDRELTKDMSIIQPVQYLLAATYFSYFDILWHRDFNINIEISVENEV